MTDLSPAMQMQCHRVSQKACDTIFGLLTDGWKMQESKTKELEDLRRWKSEAMQVMNDLQTIGKEIGLTLGTNIAKEILSYIRKLKGNPDDNVIDLGFTDGRHEAWDFPDGTVIRMHVPDNEPPITVKHAIYCFSEIIHRIHEAMK